MVKPVVNPAAFGIRTRPSRIAAEALQIATLKYRTGALSLLPVLQLQTDAR